jgi:hypothetical protein
MRRAAVALLQEADSSRWLDTPLVPRLLSALRSLPGAHSPKEAAQACAAAVAALANMFAVLPRPQDRDRFRAMLAADAAACCALLHWGVHCPEASEQLPPGQAVPLASRALTAHVGTDASDPYWTPCARCMQFVSDVAFSDAAEEAGLLRSIKGGVTPAVVERALVVAVQYPWGRSLLCRTNARRRPTCCSPSCFCCGAGAAHLVGPLCLQSQTCFVVAVTSLPECSHKVREGSHVWEFGQNTHILHPCLSPVTARHASIAPQAAPRVHLH